LNLKEILYHLNPKDNAYLEQINKFYEGKLKSYHLITIGETPDYLQHLGMKKLPIILKQSTLAKCIREQRGSRSAHELDRKTVELLPEQIRNPIMVVEERERNSLAIISDCQDKNGNNILIALKMNVSVQNMTVNEVVSFYGRSNLNAYLGKHLPNEIHIIDNKKAKLLASLLRLQLPTTLQAHDFNKKIAQTSNAVKIKESNKSVLQSLQSFKKEIDAKPLANNLERQRISQER